MPGNVHHSDHVLGQLLAPNVSGPGPSWALCLCMNLHTSAKCEGWFSRRNIAACRCQTCVRSENCGTRSSCPVQWARHEGHSRMRTARGCSAGAINNVRAPLYDPAEEISDHGWLQAAYIC